METPMKEALKDCMDRFLNNPTIKNYAKLRFYLRKYYENLNRTKS